MKFEYYTLYTYCSDDSPSIEEKLNKLAKEGWRVVTASKRIEIMPPATEIVHPFIILERAIQEEGSSGLV